MPPKRDDDFRPDDGEFPLEVGQAGGHFAGIGLAVGGALRAVAGFRAEFDDVGDVNLAAGQPHGLDDAVEQLAGGTDKGLAAFFLLGSRGFADENDVGLRVAGAEDKGIAQGAEGFGCRAAAGVFLDLGQQGGFPVLEKLEAGARAQPEPLRAIVAPALQVGGKQGAGLADDGRVCGGHGRF